MAFRFRRSIKLAPGLKVNLSKGVPSLSVGKAGATVNIGKNGTRATVGIPGSGLSYSEKITGQTANHPPVDVVEQDQQKVTEPTQGIDVEATLLALLGLYILIFPVCAILYFCPVWGWLKTASGMACIPGVFIFSMIGWLHALKWVSSSVDKNPDHEQK